MTDEKLDEKLGQLQAQVNEKASTDYVEREFKSLKRNELAEIERRLKALERFVIDISRNVKP